MPQLKSSGKAFYILLCALLGLMLFVVTQRAVSLIYYLLLNTNFKSYSFGLDYYQLSWLNFWTIIAAAFFGLWYGIWLGLHWYEMVYEEGTGGLWQHFKQHWPKRESSGQPKAAQSTGAAVKPASTSVTIKPTVRSSDTPAQHWDLDDLLKKDDVIEAAVHAVSKPKPKKAPAKRKAAAKKSAPAGASAETTSA